MLGFGPISSRSISGSPFSLVTVTATLAASASFLTFGGQAVTGTILQASGVAITFSGTAPGVWLQDMETVGVTALTFDGSPRLLVAGRPFIVRMISQPYAVRMLNDNYTVKMIAAPYTVRGYR